MIHISKLRKLIERGEFSLTFVAKDGNIVTIANCVVSSWHTLGDTFNIVLPTSEQVRTINKFTIISVNNQELYI
ncbi:MAG: hypothetical protein RR551_08275 [Mucinivorans sp.]